MSGLGMGEAQLSHGIKKALGPTRGSRPPYSHALIGSWRIHQHLHWVSVPYSASLLL